MFLVVFIFLYLFELIGIELLDYVVDGVIVLFVFEVVYGFGIDVVVVG